MKTLDALVVGGGPAGATAALALARAGLSVAVVEKAAYPRRKVCGEFVSATTWPLLRRLGVAPQLLARAGPPVTRVGFYTGEAVIEAPMPGADAGDAWGRALGREWLDQELLTAAARVGARVLQPCKVQACEDEGDTWRFELAGPGGGEQVRARVAIAANGSWERHSPLEDARRSPAADGDLLGFKAHFRSARLPAGSMPLVIFPGGYAGLVASDDGRTSFSCCIRRDTLHACRASHRHEAAGEAVLAYVAAQCRGVREALEGAVREGPWLSAGPIRPGVRTLARGRLFAVGNAAGEAHPLVAEGLSMAMQSAWLLAVELSAEGLSDGALARAGEGYRQAWRRQFEARVHASRAFATLADLPMAARAAAALMRHAPDILTWGARRSGKALALRSLEAFP